MSALNPPRQPGPPAPSFQPGPTPFRLPVTGNGFQFSWYRPLDMTMKFKVRWVHEKATVTDPIIMQPRTTMREIWNELYRASRVSRSQASLLASERIGRCFLLLQETSNEVKYRNLAFTKVAWSNTRGLTAWYERNVGIGASLKIELHTQAMVRPELLDGTVAPEERPNYRAMYVRFPYWDAMDNNGNGYGVQPPSTNWDDESEDVDEEEDDDMFGPATFTFIGPRGKLVGRREVTKKKGGDEEEEDTVETEKEDNDVRMVDVGFECGSNEQTLAIRSS